MKLSEVQTTQNAPFTKDDLDCCWPYYKDYLVQLLNGEYTIEDAREDLRGLIGSKYDPRGEQPNTPVDI